MGDETPKFDIPYPEGTDAVRDGDNYMKALADRVDEILGTPVSRSAVVAVTDWADIGVSGLVEVESSRIYAHVSAPGALIHMRSITHFSDGVGMGMAVTTINAVGETYGITLEGIGGQALPVSEGWWYLDAGSHPFTVDVGTQVDGWTFDVNSVRWQATGFGADFTLSTT